ncbi:putative peroxidase-related enzyme [Micromonospora sp. Llam0]|uniref:carboxymuconolactone decarboxylase family protein n=1 Tax=Micromonospora sp. Llam0 TaxID=2485143 RepID=UPI000F45FFDD|nr:carboxymuconolactone decarboxylase family protein [Micromonospora sp. Llam0]ROO50967.1 putative peroxidase-related enzyme [Micromonospora sp. Llam0]
MAMVQLLDEQSVPPEIARLFTSVEQEYGFVPNILRAMANCPDLLAVFVPLWAQVYRSPTIGTRLRALAALGTAKAQDCTYCVAHMTRSARQAGLVDAELVAIGDAAEERSVFDAREALILEAADALTRDPDGVTSDLRARLAAEFTDDEIVNIVLAIGMYNLTSRFLKALAIDVETIFSEVGAARSG